LLQAKYNRYVELSERFEALNETTKKLVSEREELITKAEARLQRAAKNRKLHLQNIVRKAHDEEAKAKEIAFINLLEAQNKRHDYLTTAHEIEGRLQTIQEERRLKLEERACKAFSVIERQSRIRNNWQTKLERMQEKRRKAEERITREKEEKAKERSELAQEKARDREQRISALNSAKQAEKEELQKKIQQKQEDTARRHEENMEQIRQKAIELSVPRNQEDSAVPAIVRVCTLCKVSLPSEVQELAHLRGRAHMDAVRKAENLSSNTAVIESFGLKYVCDLTMDKIDFKIQVDKNRFKLLKKHCNKLMQRLIDGGMEYENLEKESSFSSPVPCDPDLKAKIHKNIKELDRLVSLFEKKKGTPTIATNMDRLMTEIRRNSVQKKSIKDVVISLGVVNVALRVVKCSASDLPDKLKTSACNLLVGVLYDSQPNSMYCLRGTAVCTLVECCAERLNILIPEGSRWVAGSAASPSEQIPYDPVLEALLELLFSIMNLVPDPFNGIGREGLLDRSTLFGVKNRTLDIIGYLVTSSVIDRFAIYCSAVRGPIEDQPGVADLLKMILDLLVVIVYALQFCWPGNGSNGKRDTDTTQLLAALESSELAGAVSMSYTLLLHQGAPTRPRMTPGIAETDIHTIPPPPGERTASIVRSTLLLINAVARVDHQALQNVLGSEAVSLQFRHIASQLLWQVVPHRSDPIARKLLNELLIAIAYFTVGNRHNQVTIQSGQTPTVLQQLCTLPHEFFNEISGIKVLFPTLISATYGCPENIEILVQNHIDLKALDAFMQSNHAAESDILKKLKITSLSKITDRIYSVDNRENEEPPKLNGNVECPTHMTNGHATDIKC
ncbi:S phase cyclin A-associated protein in the endoplasmic reticulum, partial [Orchesella cincta]